MKTIEFRCNTCDKLLAKFAGDWKFDDSSDDSRTHIIDGGGQYLEVKCPRCKTINKKEMVGDGTVDTEALEALNRVSRHGDNL